MGLAALRGTDMNHCSQLDHLYHVTLWHNEETFRNVERKINIIQSMADHRPHCRGTVLLSISKKILIVDVKYCYYSSAYEK